MTLTNEELGTAIKELTLRLAEAVHTLTACVKKIDTDLRHHFDVLEVKQSEALDQHAVGFDTRLGILRTQGADSRQDLRNELTTRIVDVDVKLRKVIEALADRTTAELAALTDELERVVAGD